MGKNPVCAELIKRTPVAAVIITMSVLFFSSCSIFSRTGPGPTEPELRAYEGKWYVIYRFPNKYEEGLVCTTSTYGFTDDGAFSVTTAGREKESSGRIRSYTGRLWIPDKNDPNLFRVQFFIAITRDYRLVYMAPDRSCAVIGSPSHHLLWIMSRTPFPEQENVLKLIQIAKDNGYDTSRLIPVEQSCGE